MRSTRRQSRFALVLVASAAALVTLAASPLTGGAAELSANPDLEIASAPQVARLDTQRAERALLDLTNADRVHNGLAPLQLDPLTQDIARQRAANQLNVATLTHLDAAGELAFVGMLSQAGVDYQLAGENLARSSGTDPSLTQRVEDALMQSPNHRKNILEQTYTSVSIGAAVDDQGRVAFAEIFRGV